MPTPFDPTDSFNLVETATVNTILADPYLGNPANVATVHRKIKRNQDDAPTYIEGETPAIGVWCPGQSGEAVDTLTENEISLRVVLDVVAYGGDVDAADDAVKRIMAQLRRLIRIQKFSEFPEASDLDGFAAGGEISLDGDVAFAVYYDDDRGWIAEGVTGFVVRIYSQE